VSENCRRPLDSLSLLGISSTVCLLWHGARDAASDAARNFHLEGYSPRGSGRPGGWKCPSRAQVQSPSRESRDEVPQKLKQFADIVYRF